MSRSSGGGTHLDQVELLAMRRQRVAERGVRQDLRLALALAELLAARRVQPLGRRRRVKAAREEALERLREVEVGVCSRYAMDKTPLRTCSRSEARAESARNWATTLSFGGSPQRGA
jgi:hypothetical protein